MIDSPNKRSLLLTLVAGVLTIIFSALPGCKTETISPAYNNTPPEIIGMDVSPGDSIEIQDSISIYCEAIDEDEQPITYHWEAAFGTLSTDTGAVTWWKAPRTPKDYWINVTVSDPYTRTVGSVHIFVLARGATNRPPQITRLTVDPDTVSFGEGVNCTVQATDPEDDALTYIWSAEDGFFYPESGPQVRWFAPQVDGEYFLRVTVLDSHHGVSDSLPVLVVPDTTELYAADFSTDQVTGSWSTLGLLADLGTDEGVNSISWDSTNQAMAVTAKPNYGTYAFRLIGRNFGEGSFTCTINIPTNEYQRIGFVPKLIDRRTYFIISLNPSGGGWQVLRRYNDTLRYLAEQWVDWEGALQFTLTYSEHNNHATARINGELVWQGEVNSAFENEAPMGVALFGSPNSRAALFDDIRVTFP